MARIKRKIESDIMNWIDSGREALLLTGARQIGKTYLIRACIEEAGIPYVEFNFIEQKELVDAFSTAADAKELLMRFSVAAKTALIPGETIFFLDEIQECKEIVTQIKFLVEEGSYRYILSGSLLGIELKDVRSAPVGYLRIVDMFPMNLEEFFLANGLQQTAIDQIREHFTSRVPMDTYVHEKLLQAFYLYLIIGGMPEAVSVYLETNDIRQVNLIHEKIIRLYKQDFTKYEQQFKLRLIEIYDAIPSELSEKNKRFFINHLGKNEVYDRIKNDFLWLKDAGVALPAYVVTEPKLPYRISEKRNLFKLFLSDVGLLTSIYGSEVQMSILRRDSNINNGGLFENAAAQELVANGFSLWYYNNKKQGEVDFMIERNGKALPIEIKSGKDYKKHSALTNLLSIEAYEIPEAFIFCDGNLEQKGQRVYYPVYMLMCLEKPAKKELIYQLDLSGVDIRP